MRRILEKGTYNYVETLFERLQQPRITDNDEEANLLPLCSNFTRPDKTMAAKEHTTRFNSHLNSMKKTDFDFIICILIINQAGQTCTQLLRLVTCGYIMKTHCQQYSLVCFRILCTKV